MIESKELLITTDVQQITKADTNYTVRIKGNSGVYIGGKDVTIENGFPLWNGYHTLSLLKDNPLYAIAVSDKAIRILVNTDA